ncbi:hypothetical protein HMPREF1624_04758 [Sporothrix schenckii ATCC 58251]|uniref:Uncharacterized protein n=1 Tax=Sporothrix schenckii (strain ATCC 58251 / de Perez 2211183) TaxID=1391915 RepID=U7PV87_SPOS1|nr:hypothetical protein HMPREF1624_04758 [Sporothrix schenckii ATCC 58251]
MADLLVEGDGSNGNGNGNAVPTSRPQIPIPQPTSSPRSNIRGPRMIMQERQEREARRAERERMERAQAEQDARVAAEQRRQAAERERAAAAIAAAAAASAAPAPASQSTSQQVDPATQRRQQRAERTAAATSGQLAPPPTIQQQQAPQQPHISSQQLHQQQQQQRQQPPQQQQQAQPRPVRVPQSTQIPQQPINQPPISAAPPLAASGRQPSASGIPDPAPRPSDQTQPQAGLDGGDAGTGGARGQPRNSFPHAFERWEALSAHWEGLTSFWIRQLQQRSEEINQDPLNRQLARQVTDLSAAGANLFHAVVELQRLRASSERKFQRWFFEMRGDMERHTEVQAMLEAAIQEERRGRAEAIREAVENERSNSKMQKQLAEMRKELAISKDEARRAWEELGRREQEERDRVIALQEGQPTIVGGVQVVPMTQGLPLRQLTSTTGHEQQQPPPPQPQPQQQPQQPQQPQQVPQQQHQQQAPPPQQVPPQQQKTPLSALEQLPSQTQQRYQASPQQQPVYTQPPVSAAGPDTASAEYYQQPHGQSDTAPQGSDETYEEEELQYGTPSSLSAPGSTYPPSASHHYYTAPAPADYSGQGFAGPGWETIPRHHHPTRLSDVIEEDDERSRTSASQVSRGDRQ